MAVTTIYQARKVVTMNPSRPVATHVAVRDGRILGVGTLDELDRVGRLPARSRFRGKGLVSRPGRGS
jgi:hypothetical protein